MGPVRQLGSRLLTTPAQAIPPIRFVLVYGGTRLKECYPRALDGSNVGWFITD